MPLGIMEKPVDLLPASARARGEIRAHFACIDGRTHLMRAYEGGGWRLRHPKTPNGLEVVTVNTGGGILGGDQTRLSFDLGPQADVTLTSQAAEKIYRADCEASEISLNLTLASKARLSWLPQEMILFNGANLVRNVDIAMAQNAELTLVESTIFGRHAMGEEITRGVMRDNWRIKRADKLIFADTLHLEGGMQSKIVNHLKRSAIGKGARASALILQISPNAAAQVDTLRALLDTHTHDTFEWGVSAWNGMLVLRMLAISPERLRLAIVASLIHLRGQDMPRVWQ